MSPRPGGGSRTVQIARPRLSVLHVLDRVRVRMLDIQVWDVAGTMTFYTLLSMLPAAVAAVSAVSMLGLQEQTVHAFSSLFVEIFPTVDPRPYEATIGGLGSLLSASNGVAAFHRALHRVYDTREGRPFLWFRTIVLAETAVIMAVALLSVGMVVLGGEASQRLGALVGVPRFAFEAWNLVKWPILLMIFTIVVSLAYYLFPNVRLPRYRVITLGSALSVLVLFVSALLVGRLAAYATRFTEVLTALNGLIGLLMLIWLANIVIVGGAALDAEFLRARQIARGVPAWDHIDLEPQATHALDYLARTSQENERVGREVAEANLSGRPLHRRRGLRIVDAANPLAVNPSRRAPSSSPSESSGEH